MAKYEVTIWETLQHTVTVDADNESDAMADAHEIVMNRTDIEYETESHGTSDRAFSVRTIN
jgi:hypothetical protein